MNPGLADVRTEAPRCRRRVVGRLEVVVVSAAIDRLDETGAPRLREADPPRFPLVAVRAAVELSCDAAIGRAPLRRDHHGAGQCIFTEQVRRAALDHLHRIDVVEIDVRATGAFVDRDTVDDDCDSGLLAHEPLVLDAAELDLDVFAAALRVGGHAWNRGQRLLQVANVLILDLLAGDGVHA
ncbi:MAG: hypothetical protein QM736_09415 [Vicinamibacterales bacterium]